MKLERAAGQPGRSSRLERDLRRHGLSTVLILIAALVASLGLFAEPVSAAKRSTKTAAASKSSPKKRARKRTTRKQTTAAKRAPRKKTAARRAPVRTRSTRWRPAQTAPTKERYQEIESVLAGRGYLAREAADGVWDEQSIAAMKRFQQEHGLDSTGRLNSLSLIALGLGPKRETASLSSPLPDPATE